MFVRPEEDRFVTADLIRTLTSSGTAPELRDRIRRLKEAGYDEVVVQVTPGCEVMINEWARVFEMVCALEACPAPSTLRVAPQLSAEGARVRLVISTTGLLRGANE